MTGIEIILILVGLVLMVGSFMVTEKLSESDLNTIAELGQNEIKRILDKRLEEAEHTIEDQIDTAIDGSINKVERGLDKETNEKMKAIGEYSDTILEEMNKTHSEIMFLYSMLNDKQEELTELSARIGQLASDVEQEMEEAKEVKEEIQKKAALEEEAEEEEQELPAEEAEEIFNHNEKILELYKEGQSFVEIAKALGLGLGEVKLVIGLFKGDEAGEV